MSAIAIPSTLYYMQLYSYIVSTQYQIQNVKHSEMIMQIVMPVDIGYNSYNVKRQGDIRYQMTSRLSPSPLNLPSVSFQEISQPSRISYHHPPTWVSTIIGARSLSGSVTQNFVVTCDMCKQESHGSYYQFTFFAQLYFPIQAPIAIQGLSCFWLYSQNFQALAR